MGTSALIPSVPSVLSGRSGSLYETSFAGDWSWISVKRVIYSEVSVLDKDDGSKSRSFSFDDADLIVEYSKDGGMVLALIVEWKQ